MKSPSIVRPVRPSDRYCIRLITSRTARIAHALRRALVSGSRPRFAGLQGPGPRCQASDLSASHCTGCTDHDGRSGGWFHSVLVAGCRRRAHVLLDSSRDIDKETCNETAGGIGPLAGSLAPTNLAAAGPPVLPPPPAYINAPIAPPLGCAAPAWSGRG